MELRPRVVLGRNVCRLRQKRNMTQEDLAGFAEIDRRHVQRIESGVANPGIDVMQRIRKALRCSWLELFHGID